MFWKRTLFAITLMTFAVPVAAQEIITDPGKIMELNYVMNRVQDSQFIVTVILTMRGGDKRERRMESLSRLDEKGNQSRAAKYLYPPQEKGVGTLAIEHENGEDDIWVYLPALDRIRRIPSTNRSDSFMGSDFTYEDIITPRVHDYTHVFERTEACGEYTCYVIHSTPATDAVRSLTAYGSYVRWIRSDNFMTVHAQMTNKKGEPYKELTAGDFFEADAKLGRWIAQVISIKDLKKGSSSELRLTDIKVNIGVPKERFTQRYLQR